MFTPLPLIPLTCLRFFLHAWIRACCLFLLWELNQYTCTKSCAKRSKVDHIHWDRMCDWRVIWIVFARDKCTFVITIGCRWSYKKNVDARMRSVDSCWMLKQTRKSWINQKAKKLSTPARHLKILCKFNPPGNPGVPGGPKEPVSPSLPSRPSRKMTWSM